jgi:hypothetical protein
VRIAAYLIAAWFLISIVGSMVLGAGATGGLFPLLVVGIVVWLVRSYRRGPAARIDGAAASVAALDESIEHRLDALARELPPDPPDLQRHPAAVRRFTRRPRLPAHAHEHRRRGPAHRV